MGCRDGLRRSRNRDMTAINKKYALYLLHLLIGVITEEMNELIRYGIPPIGVGYVMPLKKDL